MSYWENPEKLWSFGGDCALHCPQEAAEVGRRGAAGELYCSRLPAVDQRVMERQSSCWFPACSGFLLETCTAMEGFRIPSSLPGSAHIQNNKAKQSLLNPGAVEAESDPI